MTTPDKNKRIEELQKLHATITEVLASENVKPDSQKGRSLANAMMYTANIFSNVLKPQSGNMDPVIFIAMLRANYNELTNWIGKK